MCVCVCVCIPRPSPCQSAAHLLVLGSTQDGASSFSDATNPTPTGPVLGMPGTPAPPPPLDMAMGVDFDQEKRQEGTGQTGRQKERHLEGGRLELEQASAASPEKKVPLTHWHFRGVPSLKLEV